MSIRFTFSTLAGHYSHVKLIESKLFANKRCWPRSDTVSVIWITLLAAAVPVSAGIKANALADDNSWFRELRSTRFSHRIHNSSQHPGKDKLMDRI